MNDLAYKEIPFGWTQLTRPQFAHPELLFALVIPVLLLALVWGGRWLLPSRRVVLPLDRIRGRGGWWWWTAISLAESVPALLFAVAIVILAGPQRNGPPQQKRSLTNIQFAVDVSGSMTAPFGEGTRYDASMKAIDAFLDYRKGDAFGLTFFGDAFVHWVPLTTDPSALKCSTPFMRPEIAPPPFGGTAIAKALQACKKELTRREEGDRMIVLITDGFSFDLPGADQELARELNAERVSVFCIIVGGFEPQAEIVNICRLTGGEAFRADDPEALPTFFKKIDTMKQAKVTPTIVETVDYFEPAAMLGSVLLVLGTLTLYGLRYTPVVIPIPKLPSESLPDVTPVVAGFIVAGVVVLLAVAAELLHFRRVLHAAPLAFGNSRRAMAMAAVAPVLRVLALGAAAWGLVVLLLLPPKGHRQGEIKESEYRHLVLVLDISRSMSAEDAGPSGKQKRSERAADLIQSFFERVQAERYKTTVIAVASEAKPVVLDTTDREVIRNILTELPMRHAFKPGETNMFAGLEEAAKIAKPWPPGSAVLMVVTDGDTVPATGMPKMPASIGNNVVMVGVGNPTVGKAFGGHMSRQDVSTLRQVATRLSGTYHDGNEKHLSTELVSKIDEKAKPKGADQWTPREWALLCVGVGCGVLAPLPALLTLIGTGWEPGRRRGS